MREEEKELYLSHSRLACTQRKFEAARETIEIFLRRTKRPYVAFSGGKDSLCVLHLARQLRPDITVAFYDSGAEFPDTLEFVKRIQEEWQLDLYWLEPEFTLLELYEMVGAWKGEPREEAFMAGEIKRILIDEPSAWMRDQGFDGVLMGLRGEESKGRKRNFLRHGTIYQIQTTGAWHCIPIATWTARDVWAYVASHGLSYNAVYDKPWPGGREAIRVGAYAGSTGVTIAKGRWAFLKRHYPGLWNEFAARFPGVRGYGG